MKIVKPASGVVIADIASDNAAAVKRKYEAARAGQRRWAKVPIGKRLEAIAKFRDDLQRAEWARASQLGKSW